MYWKSWKVQKISSSDFEKKKHLTDCDDTLAGILSKDRLTLS
jgi:hypothetical protein